jgi:two-component system sensor histidine kinase/response regulator
MINKSILAVDDTVSNLDILIDYLDGYDIVDTTDATEVMEILEDNKIDLILLDIVMPKINGFEVCKQIKSNPKTENIPIIFITSNSDEESVEKAYELGAVDYVTKPFRKRELLARVKTHLSLHEKNQDLEKRVEDEISKRTQQQKLLIRQSRVAAMGEMMSAITHQWKQPLNILSVLNSKMKLKVSMDKLDKEEMIQDTQTIDNTIKMMSETVSDFKNYFSNDKTKNVFCIKQKVSDIVNIIKVQLEVNNINLQIDIEEETKGYAVESEFKHVILNLISNAKDAIIQNKCENREIFLKTEKIDNTNTKLTVQDSGGGIPEDIIEKIFDNYFTTKGKDGTGIGLSMTKLIVEDEMHGTIEVCNTNDGALFTVIFPSGQV